MWVQIFIKTILFFCNVYSACGLNFSNFHSQLKIIGGNQARVGQFPYQVSLRAVNRFGSSFGHFCGGTIINDTHVLTAAHCLYKQDPDKLYVVAGALKLTDSGQLHRVKSFTYHNLYSADSFKYDIAIIRLFTPFDMDNYTVNAIPLQQSRLQTGTLCTVSGWGQTLENNSTIPNTLRYVNVPIVDWASCVKNYSKNGNIIPDSSMLCAGYPSGGKDACNGDSGGPLVCEGHLAGVVSWGAGCAERNLPGVYTDVLTYQSWILANSGTVISIEYRGLRTFLILAFVVFYLIKIG